MSVVRDVQHIEVNKTPAIATLLIVLISTSFLHLLIHGAL